MNKQKKDWEERFDEEFVEDLGDEVGAVWKDHLCCVSPVKAFIRILIEEAKEELMAEFLNQPANQHDQEVRKQAQSEIIQIIEDMPTNFPEREDDSFDQGAKHFRDKLLEII